MKELARCFIYEWQRFAEWFVPHLDDVVRLVDSYGREGTSAPYGTHTLTTKAGSQIMWAG